MQRMFALSGAKVTVTARGGRPGDLAERPVLSSDVEWIVDAWRQLHGGDDLALFPGNGIGQWFNHAVSHRSSVITRGGEAAAYVRYKRSCPISIKELLVREAKAGDILAFLLGEHCGESTGELALSLSEDALKTLFAPTDGVRVTGNLGTSDAFMLRILDEGNRVISRYCSDVSEARMPAGIVVFPAILDVDE